MSPDSTLTPQVEPKGFPPDPGNIFRSDYHRRILAHLPVPEDALQEGEDPSVATPIDAVDLIPRLAPDAPMTVMPAAEGYTALTEEVLAQVLGELVTDGHAEQIGTAYRMTSKGFAALNGGALLEKERAVDGEDKPEIYFEEDPPKEGRKLERAEEFNEELAEEDRQLEAEARASREDELKAELAALQKQGEPEEEAPVEEEENA